MYSISFLFWPFRAIFKQYGRNKKENDQRSEETYTKTDQTNLYTCISYFRTIYTHLLDVNCTNVLGSAYKISNFVQFSFKMSVFKTIQVAVKIAYNEL